PEVILAGRRTNDSMGVYVARETVRLLISAGKVVQGAKVLVLGVTFKENVRDARNTRVVELVQELESYEIDVAVYDPLVEEEQLKALGLQPVPDPFSLPSSKPNEPAQLLYDAVVLAVPHKV